MSFRKYIHIERFGNDEVQGIELGDCYIFPKLDGTNGSIWYGDNKLHFGSRNRVLSLDDDNQNFDNQNFMKIMSEHEGIKEFFRKFQTLRLYGEWLVPHSFKDYQEDAWNKFYVFDVYDHITHRYIKYDEYQKLLEDCGIDYIPPMSVIKNATYDNLLKELKANTFLVKDGCDCGEGIVIKNYDFVNQYNRTIWAKIVTNQFRADKQKNGITHKRFKEMLEQEICDKYVTEHLVEKTYSKIVNEMEGWNSKYIPRLLNTVFHDLITEELWDIVKKYKNPTINFKTLNSLTILKIKETKSELF